MLRFELDLSSIVCPECKGKQFKKYLEHGKCVHCGHPLDSYDEDDLQEKDTTITVLVNPLTGEAQVLTPPPKVEPKSPLFQLACDITRAQAKWAGVRP
jgi:phosphotransferase system IIA component